MKLLRFLLFPFSILYCVITSIRNYLFDVGILKSTSFNIPVIAVGNLSVGGTGKTPQIEYLIRLLEKDYKVAVLSRGYKRKTNGFQIVNNNHSAEDVGDEPLQFFKKFKNITVAVDADRVNGINQLLKTENPPNIVLLDDAFQHRKVKAKTYILLTKYNDLYINDFVFPTGNLRESRKGAKRADIVIVTKCPNNLSLKEQETITKKLNIKNNKKVFFTTIEYDETLRGKKDLLINESKEKKVVLVTGIANPKPLLQYLTTKEIDFEHLKYPDHHNFSVSDLDFIKQTFNKIETTNKIILTTEKDYMRLENKIDSLCYISIKTKFLEKEVVFMSEIKNYISG
ncbi:MAG: tetraacyldisaccharide 4'-kinase [Tenacibaculum sp.]|nr:tetraacyldisaccharide 4'-kinase [Tenacibaculum sp.]